MKFQIQVQLKYGLKNVWQIKTDVGRGSDLLLLQDQKVVFRFQSINSIVIPAASTGNDNSNSTTVIKTNHTNNGIWYWDIAGGFILIVPKIEETPAMCREKIIIRPTDAPAWAKLLARYEETVQPVPALASTIDNASSNKKEGGSNQKLIYMRKGYVRGSNNQRN